MDELFLMDAKEESRFPKELAHLAPFSRSQVSFALGTQKPITIMIWPERLVPRDPNAVWPAKA